MILERKMLDIGVEELQRRVQQSQSELLVSQRVKHTHGYPDNQKREAAKVSPKRQKLLDHSHDSIDESEKERAQLTANLLRI